MLQFTIPGWLKWTLGIIGLLLVACLILGIYLYQVVQGNRTASFDQAEAQVIQETEIRTVNKIGRFHGENAYYTVYGETSNGEAKLVFYPFEKNQSGIITVNQSDIASKETIRANWNNQCQSCTMFDITPAVISNDEIEPAWEITYEDDEGRYVMEYLSIYDGTRIEVRRFNRMFDDR